MESPLQPALALMGHTTGVRTGPKLQPLSCLLQSVLTLLHLSISLHCYPGKLERTEGLCSVYILTKIERINRTEYTEIFGLMSAP